MADLNSFAELIRKGKEEQRIKEQREQIKKIENNAPLLSELFKTVSTAKRIEEKRQAVVAKVDELEANQVTQEDVDEIVTEKLELVSSESEKKLLVVVKKLQEDIANLKRHVDSKPSYTMAATGGSGEVRILRMDDVVYETPRDGSVLVWDSSLNKFKLVVLLNNLATDEVPEAFAVKQGDSWVQATYEQMQLWFSSSIIPNGAVLVNGSPVTVNSAYVTVNGS